MCGIAGFNWTSKDDISIMMRLVAHRGPDDEGCYADEAVTLGHKRLSIIDLTPCGRQPMENEDGSVIIVYNGEIYNYIELREELLLKGHVFRSRADTEVIIHAYEEWGEDCLHRFNGMFAFCIYDKKKQIFFLARDRFGIKPLYYHDSTRRFVFSSEIKPLLSFSFVKREVNDSVIFDYLLFNCYDHLPETFFRGVKRVSPGHYLVFDLKTRTHKINKWYEIPLGGATGLNFKQAERRFLELFTDSVRLRMRSDVEVGSCLSGGTDSSSIVCILKKICAKDTPLKRLKTFSMVLPGTEIDETEFVERVKGYTRDIDTYFTSPAAGNLANDLDEFLLHQEEPFSATSIFAQWRVMKLASNHNMKVLLDGQGADELLAGYPFMYGYYFIELLKGLKIPDLVREIQGYKKFQLVNEGLTSTLFIAAPFGIKPFLLNFYLHHCLDRGFIKENLRTSTVPSVLYRTNDLNLSLYYRMKYRLPALLREEDKNSMAFSIETRLPFLDYRLVEFLFSLPSRYKVREGKTKHILREAMRNILPEDIRLRRSKFGFSTPMNEWMRDAKMADRVRGAMDCDNVMKYFDKAKLEKVFAGHMSGKVNAGQLFWKLVNLDSWHNTFIRNTGD